MNIQKLFVNVAQAIVNNEKVMLKTWNNVKSIKLQTKLKSNKKCC